MERAFRINIGIFYLFLRTVVYVCVCVFVRYSRVKAVDVM